MNLKQNLRPLLELESGSNDPMAYMLTIALIEVISSGSLNIGAVAFDLVTQFAVGALLGYGFARITVWIINKLNLPNSSLYPIMLLSMVLITFTVTDMAHGNGYLATYIMGIVVGNTRLTFRKEVNTFMNGMTWLFQIIMFLTLGLLVNPHEMLDVIWEALLIGGFMMLVARPLSVVACLLPFKGLSGKARIFVSWVGLRGAVPIIFATYPVVAGIPDCNQIFNIVFFITLLSLIIQGMSIAKAARGLGLDSPQTNDGNEFGVEIPEELETDLSEIVLTDEMLAKGNRLADMHLAKGRLVMLVKRNNEFIIPNGQIELRSGDKLLVISERTKPSVD